MVLVHRERHGPLDSGRDVLEKVTWGHSMPSHKGGRLPRSPAAPWSQTADGTAFLGGIPCPSRERIIPANTSPLPPLAIPGVSCGIFKGLPIGKGGDGSVPLQHQHAAVLTGKRQSSRPHDQGQWPSPASAGEIPHREGSGPSARPRLVSRTSICSATAFIPWALPKPAGSEAAPPNDRCAHPSFGFCPSPVQ